MSALLKHSLRSKELVVRQVVTETASKQSAKMGAASACELYGWLMLPTWETIENSVRNCELPFKALIWSSRTVVSLRLSQHITRQLDSVRDWGS